jgi:hypothetical protein
VNKKERSNGEVDAGERQHEPIKLTKQVEQQAIEPRVQRRVGVRRLVAAQQGARRVDPTLHLSSRSRAKVDTTQASRCPRSLVFKEARQRLS